MSKATADTELDDDTLTVAEVAGKLKVTPRTVQNMIARKEFSRVVYVTPSDLRIPVSVYREFVQKRTVYLQPLMGG